MENDSTAAEPAAPLVDAHTGAAHDFKASIQRMLTQDITKAAETVKSTPKVETPSAEPASQSDTSSQVKTAAERAKEKLEARNYERDYRNEKARREQLEREHAELSTLIERAKKDPFEAVKMSGTTLKDVANDIIEGRRQLPEELTQERREIAELKEQIKMITAAEKARAEKEAEAAEARSYAEWHAGAKALAAEHAEEFPFMASIDADRAVEMVAWQMKQAEEKGTPFTNLRDAFDKVEKLIEADTQPFFKSEKAVRRLLQNEEFRAMVLSIANGTEKGVDKTATEKGSLGDVGPSKMDEDNVVSAISARMKAGAVKSTVEEEKPKKFDEKQHAKDAAAKIREMLLNGS